MIRRLIAAAMVCAAPAVAQEAAAPTPLPLATVDNSPLLVSADMRDGIDLSGSWHYSVDPFRAGLAGFHGETPGESQQRYLDLDVAKAMKDDNRAMYEFD